MNRPELKFYKTLREFNSENLKYIDYLEDMVKKYRQKESDSMKCQMGSIHD